jgi:hypothetical protein
MSVFNIVLVWAAKTNCHRLGDIYKKHYIFIITVMEAGKFKNNELLALGCGLRNFMVCQMTIAMTIALSHG